MKLRLLFTLVSCLTLAASGQGFGVKTTWFVESYENDAKRFKSSDTNVPLFRVNWFFGVNLGVNHWPGVLEEQTCFEEWSVNKSGVVRSGHLCISNFGGERGKLNPTNLQVLTATLDKLPPALTNSILTAQKVLIGGIRSNQWFYGAYHRTNLPPEVKKLCEIVGAKLD